jgi:hypothetical protein
MEDEAKIFLGHANPGRESFWCWVGRARINFILEITGYPTIYLRVIPPQNYLDAIKPAGDECFSPIVPMLFSTCIDQHKEVANQVMKNMKERQMNVNADYLAKEFFRLKKEYAKSNA